MGKESPLIEAQKKPQQNTLKKLRHQSLMQSSVKSHIRANRSDMKNKIISKLKNHQKQKQNSSKQGWKSKFKKFIQSKQQSYEINCASTCQFSCPICLDMFMTPCPTSCGHMFCYHCIDQSIIRHGHCPSCRKFIRNEQFIQSKPFSQISHFFWMTSKEKDNYLQKFKKNQDWLSKRKVNIENIKINDLLDVKDTQHIWCKAKVLNIFKSGEKIDLLIHFQGWNDIYDEVININSQRLAPYNCFSERDDIPKYKLSQQQDNLRSRIDYRDPNDRQGGYRQMIFAGEQDDLGAVNRHFNRNLPFLFNNTRPWRIQRQMNFRLIRREEQNQNDDMSQLSSQNINTDNQLINEAINIRRGIQAETVRLQRQRRRQIQEQLQRQNQIGSEVYEDDDADEVQRQIDVKDSQSESVEQWGVYSRQIDPENINEEGQSSQRQNIEDEDNNSYYNHEQQLERQYNQFINQNIIVIPSNSNNINNQNDNYGEQIDDDFMRQNQNQDLSMEPISVPLQSGYQSIEEVRDMQNLDDPADHLSNLRPHRSNEAQSAGQDLQENASQQVYNSNPEQQVQIQCTAKPKSNQVIEIQRQNQLQQQQQLSEFQHILNKIKACHQRLFGLQPQNDQIIEKNPFELRQNQNKNQVLPPSLSLPSTKPKQNTQQINLIEDESHQNGLQIGQPTAQNKQRVRNLSPIHSSESQPISDILYNSNKNPNKKQ